VIAKAGCGNGNMLDRKCRLSLVSAEAANVALGRIEEYWSGLKSTAKGWEFGSIYLSLPKE